MTPGKAPFGAPGDSDSATRLNSWDVWCVDEFLRHVVRLYLEGLDNCGHSPVLERQYFLRLKTVSSRTFEMNPSKLLRASAS